MKKKIFSIIAFTLSLVFVLVGSTGCNMYTELSVNNAFNGGPGDSSLDPDVGFREELIYNVNYSSETLDKEIKEDKNVDVKYSNGKYKTVLTVESNFPSSIKSDIIDNLEDNNKQAYHITSEFSIDVTYTLNGQEKTFKESIKSEAWFCNRSLMYSPVYSIQESAYTLFNYSSNSAGIGQIFSKTEIKYSKSNYVIDFSYGKELDEDTNEYKEEYLENSTSTYNYTYKTITDNTMLFFILRNMKIETDKVVGLPVVSSNYGQAQTLAIKNIKSQTESVSNLTQNLNPVSEDVSVAELSFVVNNENATGNEQKVYLQNKVESSALEYRALPIKYVEPLIAYGAFVSMGELIYTLNSVNFGY